MLLPFKMNYIQIKLTYYLPLSTTTKGQLIFKSKLGNQPGFPHVRLFKWWFQRMHDKNLILLPLEQIMPDK